VDGRAQDGIRHAQSPQIRPIRRHRRCLQARQAGSTAQNAIGHVDQLNGTVNGLDSYRQIGEVEVAFHGGQPVLSAMPASA